MKMTMTRRMKKWVYSDWMEDNVWRRILVLLASCGLVRPIPDFVKAIVIAAILMTATQLQAQTYFAVGNNKQATSFAHNITISDDGSWIICNGTWYPIFTGSTVPSNSCRVTWWNAVQGQWQKYGSVVIKSTDGTQYLDGEIRIRKTPTI